MIIFREKKFTEYDAMISLYKSLKSKDAKFEVIKDSALPAVLRGNNIVIEKFVISPRTFGRDQYRTYIRLGSKLKLPTTGIRFPKYYENKRIGGLGLLVSRGGAEGSVARVIEDKSSGKKTTEYSKPDNNSSQYSLELSSSKSAANVLTYDKNSGSLVLESPSIDDAVRALNILPFGIGYKVFILQ